ncbi:8986_t:CDS:2 [Gigaspora margarita]|uniref:8986_t:CDS:1 n=1 Tax=Gigaspora margarita TaxID=4874 RepID=A0ABN7UEL1_GIGMA|nr:8986_t:CDS:2 [Gigaspora margarita]
MSSSLTFAFSSPLKISKFLTSKENQIITKKSVKSFEWTLIIESEES